MEGHIYIYGEITNYQGKDAEIYGGVNPKMVLDQIQANKEAETLIVHINSNGGSVDAGFAIYDILKTSGKKITTLIEGQCYSIATVISLAGKDRQATSNSEFLVHNPFSVATGDASDVAKKAEKIKKFEDKIANHYATLTSITFDDAKSEMEKDTFMDLEKAKEYGFITEIVDTLKAVAFVSVNNENMNDSKDKKPLKARILDFLNGVEDEPQNVVIKSAEGKDVEFPERTTGEVQAGDKATIEGENAKGEVLMANGDTYVFENGVLTEIKEKEDEPEVDVQDLVDKSVENALKPIKAELESKNNELEKLKASNEKMTKAYNGLKGIVSESVADDTVNEDKTIDNEDDTPKNVLSLTKND